MEKRQRISAHSSSAVYTKQDQHEKNLKTLAEAPDIFQSETSKERTLVLIL